MRKPLVYRPILILIALLAGVLLPGGCSEAPDALSLEIDGQKIDLPLEQMDIYLVDSEYEDEYPESFEILGPGVVLVGKFPMGTNVGYEENYSVLSGKPIAITAQTADARVEKRSSLMLSGGQVMVDGGAFVVTSIGKNEDAKTPLTGSISLKLRTPSGEKTVKGTFKVRGTTWG